MASSEHGVRTLRGLLWRSSAFRWSHSPNAERELNSTLLLFPTQTLCCTVPLGSVRGRKFLDLILGVEFIPSQSFTHFSSVVYRNKSCARFITAALRILTSSTRDQYLPDFDKVAGVNFVLAVSQQLINILIRNKTGLQSWGCCAVISPTFQGN